MFEAKPDRVREVERQAHELLRDKALGGEWFDCTAEEAIEAVKAAIVQPWQAPPPKTTQFTSA